VSRKLHGLCCSPPIYRVIKIKKGEYRVIKIKKCEKVGACNTYYGIMVGYVKEGIT